MADKIKNIVVTISFIIFLLVMLVVNILKKDTIISVSERRKLASLPEVSVTNLFDGSFFNKFEKYTMDQFIKRDEFRYLKTLVEFNIFNKNDMNNLYEYNGNIIKQEYPLNEKSVENTAKKINEIKQMYLNETNSIYYSIVPDKNYFVNDKYLKMDYERLENIMSENLKDITYINIFDCLKLENYYNTDIHWKQECLKDVLEKIAIEMKFKDRLKTNFSEQQITEFKGVYSGQLQVKTKEDVIKVLTNNIINQSKAYDFETQKNTAIYNLENINGSDKYDIFLNGATSIITINNENSEADKELIVFRDSFGSSLVPLFTEAYRKITLIDTRYISTQYLKNYVEFDNKDVLFIYSTLVINNSAILK